MLMVYVASILFLLALPTAGTGPSTHYGQDCNVGGCDSQNMLLLQSEMSLLAEEAVTTIGRSMQDPPPTLHGNPIVAPASTQPDFTYCDGSIPDGLQDLSGIPSLNKTRLIKSYNEEEKNALIHQCPSSDVFVRSFKQCSITRITPQHPHLCELNILPNRGVLNVHVYKNGGTLTRHVFLDHGGAPVQNCMFSRREEEHLKSMIDDEAWFRTAFVRDPLERSLSSYHEIKVRMCALNSHDCGSSVAEFTSMLRTLNDSADPSGIYEGRHLLTQTHFMIDTNGEKFSFDYIGSADKIQEELSCLTGIPDLQTEMTSGPSPNENVPRLESSDLTQEVTQLICDIYHDDYCCFGFGFPAACKAASCDDQ